MANLRVFDPMYADTFEPLFRGVFAPMTAGNGAEAPQIRIDVEENDKSYVVRADIPGDQEGGHQYPYRKQHGANRCRDPPGSDSASYFGC